MTLVSAIVGVLAVVAMGFGIYVCVALERAFQASNRWQEESENEINPWARF